jgi:hypothetical protein
MHTSSLWVRVTRMRASGMWSQGLTVCCLCVSVHKDKAYQSFVVDILERNTISGLCVVRRDMISVLDGMCFLVFSRILCNKG